MAQLLIRNLDTDVVKRLKARAHSNGRSVQAEARMILRDAVGKTPASVQDQIERVRSLFEGRTFSDSAALIRETRDR